MKRETKVGFTVAGTFLAMAGGALGIRMWRGEVETPPAAPASEVAQQPPATPEPQNTTVVPPPDALVTTQAAAPVFPPVVTPTAVVTPPPIVPMEPPAINPTLVVPTPVVPEQKSPEPAFPPVVETTKQPEVQPPPALNTDPPKPVDATPPPSFPPVAESTPTPPPVVPPVVDTTIPAPVVPSATIAAVPVAKLDPPSRPEGGSPAPLPDAIKSVQPTGVAAKPTRPATDSYMEEEYKLRTGDNFGGVSKKFYYHEKYAQALQQYNRDYPLASSNIKADPPRMNAGLVVWIPPIRVLEKRYPSLIPDFKPVPGQTTSASSAAPTDSPNWTSANNNAPAQPVANTSGIKTTRVRDGGETMQEIARRSLGNTLAWQEIYRLNPSLNPSATTPIPAGTLLRMPATAKE